MKTTNKPDHIWDESTIIHDKFSFDQIDEKDISIHPNIPFDNFAADVRPDIQIRLAKLLTKYKDIFRVKGDGFLPAIKHFEYSIKMIPEVSSVRAKPYQANPAKIKIMNELIKEYEDRGVLEESTLHDYNQSSTPLTLLFNPETGKSCLLGDYHSINSFCLKEVVPITHLENAVHNCGKSEFFNVCDLLSSYNQISYSPKSSRRMAVISADGKIYNSRRLIYG